MRLRSSPAWALIAALCLPWAAPAASQEAPAIEVEIIESEEIPIHEPGPDLRALFATARDELHAQGRWPESAAAFLALIERLEVARAEGLLDAADQELLVECLLFRAEARFMSGEEPEPELRRALEIDPAVPADRPWSPVLGRNFERVRATLVGSLELSVSPADAEVTIDGVAVDPAAGPVSLLAGERALVARRPGFATDVRAVEVEAGTVRKLALELLRTSAAITVITRPPGATVLIDGEAAGVTEPAPARPAPVPAEPEGEPAAGAEPETPESVGEPAPETVAAEPADEPPSGRLMVAVTPGPHRVEVRKPGFRTRSFNLEAELADYALEPIDLEPARGILRLTGIPAGAGVEIDGEKRSTEAGALVLELPEGEHRVRVELPGIGRFEEAFTLADLEDREIAVRVRPVLALVGVLGGNRLDVPRLVERLEAAVPADEWIYVDRTDAAAETLADLGLEARDLLDSARGGAGPEPGWARIRRELAAVAPAQVTVLAVLPDEVVADRADLWVWAEAAARGRPVVRSVSLEPEDGASGPLASLQGLAFLRRLQTGALLIDAGESGPVVAGLTPGGPAAAAGLRVGDRIAAVAGAPVADSQEVREAIRRAVQGAAPGAAVDLQLAPRGAGAASPETARAESVRLTPEWELSAVPPDDPGFLAPAVLAVARAEAARRGSPAPTWLLKLHQAAARMALGDWEEAVLTLREAGPEAPSGPGLGRPMVDYWLGVAYLALDPVRYAGEARAAFERAGEAAQGRLFAADGPLVAPRARARLALLGAE